MHLNEHHDYYEAKDFEENDAKRFSDEVLATQQAML
jgi:hypothetical protein